MMAKEEKNKLDALEKELRHEKQRTSFANAILESGNLIVWSVDTEFKLVSFNQNYFTYLQPSDNADSIVYEADGKLVKAKAEKFWQRHYKKALKGNTVNLEIRIEHKKQNYWIEVFLNPVYSNEAQIIAVSGVAYDITEKTESRRKLYQSEEKFRTIFESFQDLYFRTDFKGNIKMLSPSVKDLIGYTEKELLNQNVTNYYIYSTKIKSLFRLLVAHGNVRNFEVRLIHKSGRVLTCICNIRLIYRNGKPKYIEGVARDITELKKANEELVEAKEFAEKSLRIKERFLANMSHEIKTPLNGIMGMLHLFDERDLNSDNKRHFDSLKNSADILMNVLNDLLDLSKIEAGKMELRNTVVDTTHLINQLNTLFELEATRNGLKLNLTVDKSVPKYILADEIKLMQVYSNLISNAIKFSKSGGKISVGLNLKKKHKNKSLTLEGSVKDNGIGIAKSDYKNLFKSFTQLDNSASKTYEGTGLGLYISKKLVELMHGKIEVESKPDKGSLFTFTFDTLIVSKTVNKTWSKASEITSNARVLVVDDNHVNLQISAEILKRAGCRVKKAKSGAKALEKAAKKKFDLILLDIQMPEMDGLETLSLLKKLASNKDTPVIAMTAYSLRGDKEKYLKAGMDDYISKPVKPQLLLSKVRDWTNQLNIAQLEHENQALTKNSLNESTIASLMKYGGKELVVESVAEFNNECENQLEAIEKLFKVKDFDEILIILHTLKGNAGTLGADRLAYCVEYLEEEVKKKNYHIFESSLAKLKKCHQDFKLLINQI